MLLSFVLVLTVVGTFAQNPCTEEVMRASEIQLFANPQDAQSYLICTDVEVFISMPCSPGTTFNAQARHCLPANYEQPKCPENFCMNNADCDLNENSEPICMCRVGFTGQRCEVNIDECEVLGGNSVCSVNNGRCVDQVNAFYCEWSSGAEVGMTWETRIPMPCNLENIELGKQFFDMVAENGNVYLQCQSVGQFMVRRCAEMLFWHQELRTCSIERPLTKTGVCQTFPCRNDGVCEDLGNSNFQCHCKKGFTGAFCEEEVDVCLSQPCMNGGRCVSSNGDYNCICQDNLVDKSCATGLTNPCGQTQGVKYFPHPFDRNSYVQCSLGLGFLKICAPGLLWDQDTNTCIALNVKPPQRPRASTGSSGYGITQMPVEVPSFIQPTPAPAYATTTVVPQFVPTTQSYATTPVVPQFVPTTESYATTPVVPQFVPTTESYAATTVVPQFVAPPTLPKQQHQSSYDQSVPQMSFQKPTLLPTMQQPGFQKPTMQQPSFQQPTMQQPGFQQPTMQLPSFQQPTMQQPGFQKPTMQLPSFQQPTMQQPGFQKPTMHQPTMQQPIMHQPTMQQPGFQQPTMQHPTMHQPTMNMNEKRSSVTPSTPQFSQFMTKTAVLPTEQQVMTRTTGPSKFGERTLRAMRKFQEQQ